MQASASDTAEVVRARAAEEGDEDVIVLSEGGAGALLVLGLGG